MMVHGIEIREIPRGDSPVDTGGEGDDGVMNLLPCPFCGQKPTVMTAMAGTIITCTNLRCVVLAEAHGQTEESAMKKWNKRTCGEVVYGKA